MQFGLPEVIGQLQGHQQVGRVEQDDVFAVGVSSQTRVVLYGSQIGRFVGNEHQYVADGAFDNSFVVLGAEFVHMAAHRVQVFAQESFPAVCIVGRRICREGCQRHFRVDDDRAVAREADYDVGDELASLGVARAGLDDEVAARRQP